jgi:hypothetical protein
MGSVTLRRVHDLPWGLHPLPKSWSTSDSFVTGERHIRLTTSYDYARVQIGHEVSQIRNTLRSDIHLLTATHQKYICDKIDNLEVLLRQRRESTVSTTHSLSPSKKGTWRNLRKEWESVGLTVDMFQKNREYITQILGNFLHRGEIHDIEGALDVGADELLGDGDIHMDDFPSPRLNPIPIQQRYGISSGPSLASLRANAYP